MGHAERAVPETEVQGGKEVLVRKVVPVAKAVSVDVARMGTAAQSSLQHVFRVSSRCIATHSTHMTEAIIREEGCCIHL